MKQEYKETLKRFQLVFGLLLFIFVVSLLSDSFLTGSNIFNVLRQTSVNAIIAAGMTFVILTGGIDLSVGSIFAFSGAVGAYLLASGQHVLLAVLGALAIGLCIGMVNGFVIVRWNLQPFIVTLATMVIFRGATLVLTDGRPISTGSSDSAALFAKIGSGSIMGIPNPIWLMVLVFVAAYFILKQTRIGRYVYATGGNQEATKLSGVSISKVKIFAYGVSGLLAALAGIIITARLSSAQPTAGAGYELDAIAAVVLGGTSLAGGIGSIFGTAVGALIIGVLNNALNLLDVSSYYQQLAKGLVILIAILLDRKEK
jgi:ribose transport system permease protein